MKIRFLGAHNVETASTKLPGLLVDGVLALDAGSLTSTLSIEEMISLKAVLLTHQHYDHLRDMPMLGMNLFLNKKSTTIYGAVEVRDALTAHLLNGPLYPRFLEKTT
jgi:ribonuclease BN (tRNA processing enzyme)